jgi:hypothetical protein
MGIGAINKSHHPFLGTTKENLKPLNGLGLQAGTQAGALVPDGGLDRLAVTHRPEGVGRKFLARLVIVDERERQCAQVRDEAGIRRISADYLIHHCLLVTHDSP